MNTLFPDESKPDDKSGLDIDPNLASYTNSDPESFADPNVEPYINEHSR